jgi:UDP:flavonoid glycosyltransferase YjiC (YdhE family)
MPRSVIKALYNYWDRKIADPLYAPNINFLRKELGLEPIERILVCWHSPDRVLAFFPSFFAEPQPDWPPQTRLVGFPFFDAASTHPFPDELSGFIKASKVTVVFTAGTANVHARQFFRESVSVCEAIGCCGIFLTHHREQIPDVLPETVRHFQYVPFSQLFPLVDAVVHHGGLGTVVQCLRAGARQLIVPFAFDQPDNALRVERLGVGLSIKPTDYHGETVIQKMNELLKSERLKKTTLQWKQTLQEQETDAFTLACQEIEAVIHTEEKK